MDLFGSPIKTTETPFVPQTEVVVGPPMLAWRGVKITREMLGDIIGHPAPDWKSFYSLSSLMFLPDDHPARAMPAMSLGQFLDRLLAST